MTPLRQRMIREMELRQFSPCSINAKKVAQKQPTTPGRAVACFALQTQRCGVAKAKQETVKMCHATAATASP